VLWACFSSHLLVFIVLRGGHRISAAARHPGIFATVVLSCYCFTLFTTLSPISVGGHRMSAAARHAGIFNNMTPLEQRVSLVLPYGCSLVEYQLQRRMQPYFIARHTRTRTLRAHHAGNAACKAHTHGSHSVNNVYSDWSGAKEASLVCREKNRKK
jgi:hypothetical protein